ncbi:MAG TPA: hypothetical protein GXZ90_05080 [Clostridiales bacterium]|nr:hypothetical protein [Clostridiales bacterium]
MTDTTLAKPIVTDELLASVPELQKNLLTISTKMEKLTKQLSEKKIRLLKSIH